MERIRNVIQRAQEEFTAQLAGVINSGGVTLEVYQRYLSMQYHLTRGVQRYFITAAAHPSLSKRRALRKFLFDFANEEELHYIVAANDLLKLGLPILGQPLDVALWHAYFGTAIVEQPFMRLGAACVLENISAGPARPWVQKALKAGFRTRDDTKFLVLHQHEILPHGQQLLDGLSSCDLQEVELLQILLGARQGTVMYLRMVEWAVRPVALASFADSDQATLDSTEAQAIRNFAMKDLDL